MVDTDAEMCGFMPDIGRHQPGLAFGHRCLHAASAKRLTMRVEDQQIDIVTDAMPKRAKQFQLQSLDGHIGGNLANEPPGIRESRLDGKPATTPDIVNENRLL